jgi:hypothetical protein
VRRRREEVREDADCMLAGSSARLFTTLVMMRTVMMGLCV